MASPKVSRAEFDAKIAVVKEIDWARLAAYIDSEGCIFINRTCGPKRTRPPQYVLTVNVGNTDLRLLAWLSQNFGGSVYFAHSKKLRQWSKKPVYSWRLFEGMAAVVLEHCLPYFICKRAQAEIGLAYRVIREQGSKGRRLVPSDIEARDEMYSKIRELNSGSAVWNRRRNGGNDGMSSNDISQEIENGSHV